MFKKLTLASIAALGLATSAYAAGEAAHVHDVDFSFEGPFGTYDQMQLQRGLKVYTEVCAACHGLKFLPIRTLSDPGGPGFSDDVVRGYAAQYVTIYDPELEEDREAKPTDNFPEVTGAEAPDLTLMAKARAGFHGPYGTGISQFVNGIGGPEYIYTLLTSYEEAPECAPEDFAGYYNAFFASGGYPDECKDEHGHHLYPGSWIGMAPPLDDGLVEFDDGHSSDLHHAAEDISAFLMWTAEPKMMARKQAGLTAVLFLAILASLLYLTNKRLWAPIKKSVK